MNTIHNQASVTKSFTSALVGLAIDKGYISSVNEKVYDYFPEYSELRDEQKNQMTIEHLLSMTSGFEWDIDTDGDAMRASPDWIQYVDAFFIL